MSDTIRTTVIAEDAPVGVQLWPTISPEYADNFTLTRVEIVRAESAPAPYVRWTYRNGTVRTFDLGEEVVAQFAWREE